jgi:hypothetical protein
VEWYTVTRKEEEEGGTVSSWAIDPTYKLLVSCLVWGMVATPILEDAFGLGLGLGLLNGGVTSLTRIKNLVDSLT